MEHTHLHVLIFQFNLADLFRMIVVLFAIITSHCIPPPSQVCVVGCSEVLVGGSGPDICKFIAV